MFMYTLSKCFWSIGLLIAVMFLLTRWCARGPCCVRVHMHQQYWCHTWWARAGLSLLWMGWSM